MESMTLEQVEGTIDQLVSALINDQILDEQFTCLMQLQDETNPVSLVACIYIILLCCHEAITDATRLDDLRSIYA